MNMFLKSLLVLALGICWGGASAEEISLKTPTNAVVTVTADGILHKNPEIIHVAGNIEITHPLVTITNRGKATIFLVDNYFGALKSEGINTAKVKNKLIQGKHLFYDEESHLLTVSGRPAAREGHTTYTAEKKILCYTETGVMQFEPHAQIIIDKTVDRKEPPKKRKKFLGIF
jgi:hypothetical protein